MGTQTKTAKSFGAVSRKTETERIQNYPALVVGGGIAGLTCAAYLCQNNIKTLLVEKSAKTGGLVNTFWHKGFAFDSGARAFENSGIICPMLRSLGIEIDFIENPVSIGIALDWINLNSKASVNDYGALLKRYFPEQMTEINHIVYVISEIMGYLDVIYGIDNPLFMDYKNNKAYLKSTLLPWFFKYLKSMHKIKKFNQPVYPFLRQFTRCEALIDLVAQHFFKDTPAFFALSYFGLYLDYLYPVGGTGKLAETLTDYIIENGGVIWTETKVDGVDQLQKRLTVTRTNQMELEAVVPLSEVGYEQLVWAADQTTFYSLLKEPFTGKIERLRDLTANSQAADSVLTLFIAVDRESECFRTTTGAHCFYTACPTGLSSIGHWGQNSVRDDDETSLYSWLKDYLAKTTYEISIPVLRDASLAPYGQTGLVVSTLIDYELVKHFLSRGQYKEFKDYCIEQVISVLEQSIFPGLRYQIIFVICGTPVTIERRTGNKQGGIAGWSFANPTVPSITQFTKMTKSINTPLPDIYQCGQWTFSPAGIPTAILTGKLAADAVTKTLKR